MRIKVLSILLFLSTTLACNYDRVESPSPYDADDEREEVGRVRKLRIVLPRPHINKGPDRKKELEELYFALSLYVVTGGSRTKIKRRTRENSTKLRKKTLNRG